MESIKDCPECSYSSPEYSPITPRDKSKKDVFELLEYGLPLEGSLSDEHLKAHMLKLQHEIEECSVSKAEVEDLFRDQPDIFNMLINRETNSARQLLIEKNKSKEIKHIVSQLDEYTLEAASVFTLCNLYHASSKRSAPCEVSNIHRCYF